jgi:hypothetical protein
MIKYTKALIKKQAEMNMESGKDQGLIQKKIFIKDSIMKIDIIKEKGIIEIIITKVEEKGTMGLEIVLDVVEKVT